VSVKTWQGMGDSTAENGGKKCLWQRIMEFRTHDGERKKGDHYRRKQRDNSEDVADHSAKKGQQPREGRLRLGTFQEIKKRGQKEKKGVLSQSPKIRE